MAVLQEGQRLGPYVIQDLLGRGGMAEVYRAVHETLEREVAIKILNPALNADPTFPLRFRREAKAVAHLNHPNIVTIYDFGEQGELAFLVMELAPGGTLRDLAAQFWTLKDAVEGLAPVCEALQYAHDSGVVHRDIKPINVLVGGRGQELLADFGLARLSSESLDFMTEELTLGSPHYMPPEQIEGAAIDRRADIYALGIVTYEIIAGRLPYIGTTATAVIQQQLVSPPPSIRTVLPDVPESLDAAIQRAMAKRPEDRFGSVTEFLAELRRAAAEAPDVWVGVSGTSRRGGDTAPIPSAEPTRDAPLHLLPPAETEPLDDPDKTIILPRTLGRGGQPPVSSPPTPPVTPQPAPVAQAAASQGFLQPALHPPSGGHAGGRRRATSFNSPQWLALGTALLVVVFINAVGLWLTLSGNDAAQGSFGAGVTTYIGEHLGAFKSVLTALALILAALAVLSMRLAIVNGREVSQDLYRRLRRYHRLVGYLAIIIAFAVGFLTCIGIFGFGTKTPRAAVHSTLGSALLILIVAKIAVVRYFPSQRRHLKWIGQLLLLVFFLVFATSTIPFLWSHLTGTSNSNPYNPYVGRAGSCERSVDSYRPSAENCPPPAGGRASLQPPHEQSPP